MSDTQKFLEQMIVSTINAREQEQHRVSRILHDDVGQVLSAVGLLLDALKLDFQKEVPELKDRANEIQKMLEVAVKQVRALSYDLNPSIVERVGLQMALERAAVRRRDEFAGTFDYLYDPSVRVPLNVGNAWYKIAELALENALRHSGAKRIELTILRTKTGFTLQIRDNGKGFSTGEMKNHPKGLGLLLIRHYASQARIRVEVRSILGKGTVVKSTFVPAPVV